MAKSGSIRKCLLDGVSYNVPGDVNVSKTPKLEKEVVPHSGGNLTKITKASGNVEGLTVIVSPSEYEALEALADSVDDYAMSYTTADGSVFRANGEVMLGNYESEENRCELTLMPRLGTWDIFAKS